MKQQAGKQGKGKGGRNVHELPASIKRAAKKPTGNLTFVGRRKTTKKK